MWFFDRSSKVNRWHVILDIDQSGSMGQSIIYSSVMACVLASMSAVKTSVVAFDTQIMDLTPLCADPVDLLFGFQRGGGTDIANSIAYCQGLVESPARTLFFIISDLVAACNRAALLRRLEELRAAEPCFDARADVRVEDAGSPHVLALCRRAGERELICLFNFAGEFVHARVDRDGGYSELMYGTHYDSIRSVVLWPYGFAWLLRDTEHPEKEASQ